MTSWYTIGGIRFSRLSTMKLSAAERAEIARAGRTNLRRPVVWPLPDRTPDFARAYPDRGGTDIWGPGPYLKVPNVFIGDPDGKGVDRVFCPWGYPPDRVRVMWSGMYLQFAGVKLDHVRPDAWECEVAPKNWTSS